MRLTIAFTFALAMAGTAIASPPTLQENTDARAILEQQRQIGADVAAGTGRYAGLTAAQREVVLTRQAEVRRLLEGRASMLELSEADRIRTFNALEAISAVINDEANERTICRRHKPVGSNRTQTVCKTVAQLRADEQSVQADTGRRTLQCSEATMGPGGCAR
ncbi:hypothetical protein [Lysobacter humi (ex Lee et al. 2017)]